MDAMASMSNPGLMFPRARRFFPLHLKFMLSYLVLASAILAVSVAFAWRGTREATQREQAALAESSVRDTQIEFDRRQERALAVVNLAAADSGLARQIIARRRMELGPGGAAGDYGAVATYFARPEALPASIAAPRGSSGAVSGAAFIDGAPEAFAVSPVRNHEGDMGFIMVTVRLSDMGASVGHPGAPAGFFLLTSDGRLTIPSATPGSNSGPVTTLAPDELRKLTKGQPVSSQQDTGELTSYLPLPSAVAAAPGGGTMVVMLRDAGKSGAGTANGLLGLAVLTFAVGLFIAHFLARAMSRPVEQVTEATERIAAGDLSYQLPSPGGHDELAVLAGSFNRMTRMYRVSQAEVEAGALQLEQEVVRQDLEINTLFDISRAITSILDVNALLHNVLLLSLPLVGASAGAIWTEPRSGGTTDLSLAVALDWQGKEGIQTLGARHPLLADMGRNGWQVSVLIPMDEADRNRMPGRQTFFMRGRVSDSAPVESRKGLFDQAMALPGLRAAQTQIAVPIAGQDGTLRGLLAIVVEGRRPLSGHEALLLFNITALAGVAVENAGLYSLAQRRGRQIEILMREVQHRITNNLAAVSGMLSMQLAHSRDETSAAMIRDNIARIGSIAQVHRLLAGELRDEVRLTRLILTVCQPTLQASTTKVNLDIKGEDIMLPARRAVSVALIINELATNSVKHGFARRSEGRIRIGIAREGSRLRIDYCDDGAGAQEGEAGGSGGLGTRIIDSLVSMDLGGKLEKLPGNGYGVRISFPVAAAPDGGQTADLPEDAHG